MKNSKRSTIYFRLELKSPVHVGSNEVYEPTGFVVDEGKKFLVSFDPADFIESLDGNAREEFSCICRKGTIASLVEVYRFMNRYKDHVREGKTVSVSNAFIAHFKKTLSLTGENIGKNLNKYQIKRTAFNSHLNTPYIPGSSIKGSLRTAVLNYRNGGERKPFYRYSTDMEKELVGGAFQTDPFRLVKVSDFIPVGKIESRIVYGVNRKKKTSKFEARGPEQILEVMEQGAVFWGFVTIEEPPADSKIRKPVTKKELLLALTQFYEREKKREEIALNAVGIPPVAVNPADDQHLLRVGLHSGAECVTVDGHRKIKIMKGKGQKAETKEHAITLWLAGNSKDATSQQLKPFGWAVLKELSQVENARLREKIDQEKEKKRELELEIISRKLRKKKEREDAFLAQKEKENRQKEVEEKAKAALAAKKREWENLKEEARDLAQVRGDELALTCAPKIDIIQEVWPRLAGADADHRKVLAAAFRDRWKKEGKWEVKKKKSKQFEKVRLVKEILGEVRMEKGE